MGTMRFQLPPEIDPENRSELSRAYLIGGPDLMPFQTQARCENGELILYRRMSDSGAIQVPWNVANAGQVIACSGTLMEREKPYQLLVELARGKLNQLRNQIADWRSGGLVVPDELASQLHDATRDFCRTISADPDRPDLAAAEEALEHGFATADQLVHAYIHQVFGFRHQNDAPLKTKLGCGIPVTSAAEFRTSDFDKAFQQIRLRFPWKNIEPEPGKYCFDHADEIVRWASETGLNVVGGPLIDFGGGEWPTWLWENDLDFSSFTSLLCDYVEKTVRHFAGRIKRWEVATGLNSTSLMPSRDEDLYVLMVHLIEAARAAQPEAEIMLTVSQPWGEYIHTGDRMYASFVFADTMVRANANIKLSAINVEILMGARPGGSYCRDLLETSRILDLYAVFGLPLHVTLAYPSATTDDPMAYPDATVDAGRWREGYTPIMQADWATCFGSLALCKPYVQGVSWAHWSDGDEHAFPHCGLVDADGNAKPALDRLRILREEHLETN